MAYVAVNLDGTEVIGTGLTRCRYDEHFSLETSFRHKLTKKDASFWADIYDDPDDGYCDISVELPKGSIRKLIGKDLTWDDEPEKL